jgi:YebC/PmpR family DNA-binding regulatory protein
MIDTLTDNRNRTTAEVRSILTKSGGNLGENGCVSWIFEKKGVITLDAKKYDETAVMEVALDAGADDIQGDEEHWEVVTDPSNFENVKKGFIGKGMEMTMSDIMRVPKTTVKLDEKTASKVLTLMERLEDNDDVQSVASNFDIPDEVLQSIER